MKTNIQKIRESKGMTRVDLAQRSGISYETLWRIETERRKTIFIKTLQRLAHALEVPVDKLVVFGGCE